MIHDDLRIRMANELEKQASKSTGSCPAPTSGRHKGAYSIKTCYVL